MPSSSKNKSNKKNNAQIDPKLLKMLKNFEYQRTKGQAEKAIIEAKKSRLSYLKERGSLISKEFINDFVINVFSTHNERVLILPEKLVDSIISIVRTNDDSSARTKLLDKLKNEISDILESENEEIKEKLKKKSLK